jgi:hypothetical protein
VVDVASAGALGGRIAGVDLVDAVCGGALEEAELRARGRRTRR